jgi:hypothetical protein
MNTLKKHPLLTWLLLAPMLAVAQSPTPPTASTATPPALPDTANGRPYYLLLRDGTSIRGRIVRRDSVVLTIRKPNGQLTYVEPELIDRIVLSRPDDAPADAATGPNRQPRQRLLLRDGTSIIGRVMGRRADTYTVELVGGQLTFVEASLVSEIGTLTDDDPGEGRFAPFLLQRGSAANPRQGSVYYRNSWLIQNELVWGVADFLSLGVVYTPTNWFLENQGYVNSLRFTGQLGFALAPWLRLAATVAYAPYQNYERVRRTDVMDYQLLTDWGRGPNRLMLAYGWQTNGDPYQRRYFRIGATIQLGRLVALISDNTVNVGGQINIFTPTLSNGSYPTARLSAALRIGGKQQAVDLGVITAVSRTGIVASDFLDAGPYIGYSIYFGR